MKYDAIIFDVDGTLWNACPATAKALNMALEKFGLKRQISTTEVEGVVGKPFAECIEALLPELRSDSRFPELAKTMDEYEKMVVEEEGGEFYQGVKEGIKSLSKLYQIFLVSNCQDWYLDLFLKFSGVKSYLTGFDCHGLSGKSKPEMLMVTKNNYHLINPLYVGDTDSDLAAAKKVGIDFIHALYGFGACSSGCKSCLTFEELVSYLQKSDKL